MDAQPMMNCPVCGAERPDLLLPWCPRPDCPAEKLNPKPEERKEGDGNETGK